MAPGRAAAHRIRHDTCGYWLITLTTMSPRMARASAARCQCRVIGAGIVGNSLAHHLARLGWRDIVLVDKGPMPNPGGSTGHASNFIFPIDYAKRCSS